MFGSHVRQLVQQQPQVGLVITVPALGWLFSSWDVDLGHHRRYAKRELAALVARCGFDVIETS